MSDPIIDAISQIVLSHLSPELRRAIVEKLERDETPNKEYLTIKETQQVCGGVSRVTIYNWNRAGILKGYKIGGRRLYRADEVRNAIKKTQSKLQAI